VSTGIVWFRQDLRLADNPALRAACKECDEVVCVFIDDPTDQTVSQLGAASRVWLHHSLASLAESLEALGSKLVLIQGNAEQELTTLSAECNATNLYWNRCYDPVSIKRDKKIKKSLAHLNPASFNAMLNEEPWNTLKGDGTPYRVFTPFWRMRAQSLPGEKPLSAPRAVPSMPKGFKAKGVCSLNTLSLLPKLPWHKSMMSHWQVGEKNAIKSLKQFLKAGVNEYGKQRDIPSTAGTSKMSPHLHFGEISPRQIVYAVFDKNVNVHRLNADQETFVKEVLWREFAYSLLFHFPHTIKKPLDKRFDNFPWETRIKKPLTAWQRGMTGVPIVDAGMRELYETGWMHNRVRMVVASYLIKNLMIPWQQGEQWFRDTLVDADLASNAMGWQWAAGSGADAAPYFRIFNPVLQGEKFDSDGEYVRRWVPELSEVPKKFIHKPWELPEEERALLDRGDGRRITSMAFYCTLFHMEMAIWPNFPPRWPSYSAIPIACEQRPPCINLRFPRSLKFPAHF